MLKGKERAALRAQANKMPAIFQVGKNGLEENLITQVDDALTARELIKIRILDTSLEDPREVADYFAKELGAEVIQVVGFTVVLYRKNPEKN
ncbi:MAG: ribosome assembly RNA-binding protein YhbY [Clostridia bacterium]|nr:ribosome assembly RNA-binding protein YhbY [Clostridia bacterium]MCR5055636.1 ribosome assembly RNA-binding protein YhbY [Clostridia bacterium]